jgi:hypothetical protein
MRLAKTGALIAVVVSAALLAAAPAMATFTTKSAGTDNTKFTLTLKTGTFGTLSGSYAGVPISVSCAGFSISGTKDAGVEAITGQPVFSGCVASVAGWVGYTCKVTTALGWSLRSNGKVVSGSVPFLADIKAVTITCIDLGDDTCTMQITGPQTVGSATSLSWTNAKPGTLTGNAIAIKQINVTVDCFGASVTNATGALSAVWSSSQNATVTIS